MSRIIETKQEIVRWCNSLDMEDLDTLTDDQIHELDAVDTNWCESDDEVSCAIFAQYEAITGRI